MMPHGTWWMLLGNHRHEQFPTKDKEQNLLLTHAGSTRASVCACVALFNLGNANKVNKLLIENKATEEEKH